MKTRVDRFLDGRLHIKQPVDGYRAGADPVFLAAAVPAKPGDSVLELGCGAGVAMLCLKWRVPGASMTGLERERDTAALAQENLDAARMDGTVLTGDLAQMPATLKAQRFDHVMFNPPFFDRQSGTSAEDAGREAGRGADTPLSAWTDAAIRRLTPGGTLTIIHRASALPDLLATLDHRLGDTTLLPLIPREGRDAKLIILQARMGRKSPFRIAAPLILHKGSRHERDENSYSDTAQAILRDGQPFPAGLLSAS